jgi:hypothetical protein
VSRNGDLWFFLTNEERDVAREIGNVEVSSAEKPACCVSCCSTTSCRAAPASATATPRAITTSTACSTARPTKRQPRAHRRDRLALGDDWDLLSDAKAVLRSSEGNGRALVRLAEGERFDIELTLYRQIEKYIDSPKASNATPSLRTILLNRKDENRERRSRLREQLSSMLLQGDFYALGQRIELKSSNPTSLLDELGNYLITNTYTKLGYLKHRNPDPIAEIRAILQADEISQRKLALGGEEGNPLALAELREFLQLKASNSRVILDEVVNRFTGIPWGWKPEWEVVLLIARLFMAGEIKLMMDSATSSRRPRSNRSPSRPVSSRSPSSSARWPTPKPSRRRASCTRSLFSNLPPKTKTASLPPRAAGSRAGRAS